MECGCRRRNEILGLAVLVVLFMSQRGPESALWAIVIILLMDSLDRRPYPKFDAKTYKKMWMWILGVGVASLVGVWLVLAWVWNR